MARKLSMVIKGCCWEGECESRFSNIISILLNICLRSVKDCQNKYYSELGKVCVLSWCGFVFESPCLRVYDMTLFVGVI